MITKLPVAMLRLSLLPAGQIIAAQGAFSRRTMIVDDAERTTDLLVHGMEACPGRKSVMSRASISIVAVKITGRPLRNYRDAVQYRRLLLRFAGPIRGKTRRPFLFFLNEAAPPEISPLSLPYPLPF